jgi:hypothetical protein
MRDITDHLILGGDFNSVINGKDSTGNSNHSHSLDQETRHWCQVGQNLRGKKLERQNQIC